MSESRDRILRSLRRAGGQPADLPDRTPRGAGWSREERIRRFADAMRAVRAEVHEVGRDDWPSRLADLAAAKGIRRLLYAPATAHGEVLESQAGEVLPELVPYDKAVEAWKDRLFDTVDAAFTGSWGGIAETGSLILWPDSAEPRLMSLVPPVHFVLLDADRIHDSFERAMAGPAWSGGMPSNVLLISGPSKSADIEQTLAYGVHGPRELVVLLRD